MILGSSSGAHGSRSWSRPRTCYGSSPHGSRRPGWGNRCGLRQATFEDVDLGAVYDVVAAQSFHWAAPETRWVRFSSLLCADGLAYLVWNGWGLVAEAHDLDAVTGLYAASGQGLRPDVDDDRAGTGWAESEIDAEPATRWCSSGGPGCSSFAASPEVAQSYCAATAFVAL